MVPLSFTRHLMVPQMSEQAEARIGEAEAVLSITSINKHQPILHYTYIPSLHLHYQPQRSWEPAAKSTSTSTVVSPSLHSIRIPTTTNLTPIQRLPLVILRPPQTKKRATISNQTWRFHRSTPNLPRRHQRRLRKQTTLDPPSKSLTQQIRAATRTKIFQHA
jgi:hypothetical protein